MKHLVAMIVCATAVASCASSMSSVRATRQQRVFEQFGDRVDRYMDVRHDAVEATAALEPTPDPKALVAARKALGAEIRRRRSTAVQGDVFTADVRAYFRELLTPILAGERGEDVRFRLEDDAPDPGAVPLAINAPYPAGLSFPTTPYAILSALPSLPAGLTYRFIGRDLILLDGPADVIVDYMRNALPRKPAA